jgi:hypothetical protein
MSMTSEGLRPARRRGTIKLAGARASAVHSRTGALDRPELAHDEGRAIALNRMQATPREDFELRVTSAGLLALMRLAASTAGWLPRKLITGSGTSIQRADVAALIRAGWVDDRKKGYEITEAGNALVRELVAFAQGEGQAGSLSHEGKGGAES